MPDSRESYEKFSYLLRPSKQVERKLIIEGIQQLRNGGFSIPDYVYVGLGSVYYADFVLFHKYLYLNRMVCAEASDIPRRMRFNKPFPFVELRMQRIGDVLPSLRRSRRHLVWLDYDYGLNEDVLQDLIAAINVLVPDSIILVTVDVEPDHQAERGLSDNQRLRELLAGFPRLFDRYTDRQIRASDFTFNAFPRLVVEILRGVFVIEAARREGVRFFQLFNFLYADGAQMLTFGGVVGNQDTWRRLRLSRVLTLPFITNGREPVRISVPPLTPREKDWLDQNITRTSRVRDVKFELRASALRNFRKYRRHYPAYFESLI